MTVTFLPNNKVSHMEVLAVNKERISSRGQRHFFYSCNMVMQNLKKQEINLVHFAFAPPPYAIYFVIPILL